MENYLLTARICRCPADSSASFLVRKLPAAVGKAICVQAPTLGADSQTMDTWIHHFVDLLEAAAPSEEKREGEQSASAQLLVFVSPTSCTQSCPAFPSIDH